MVAKPSGHKNKHVLGIAARWSLNAMWKLEEFGRFPISIFVLHGPVKEISPGFQRDIQI